MINKLLLTLLKENKKETILVLMFKILFAIAVTMMSYSLTFLFDVYTLQPDKFLAAVALVGGMMIMTVVLSLLSDYFKANYIRGMNMSLKSAMTETVVQYSDEAVIAKDTGKAMSWFINDAQQIEAQVFEQLITLIYMLTLVFSAFISIFSLHWSLAIAAILSMTLSLVVPNVTHKYLIEAQETFTQANEKYTEAVRDNVEGLGVFFFGNALQTFRQRMINASAVKEGRQFNYSLTQTKVGALILLVSLLSQFGLIAFSLYMSRLGLTTAGSVLSIASLSGNLFNGLQGAVSVIATLKAADVLLDKFQTTKEENNLLPIENDVMTIALKKVTFTYASLPLVENFSYTFVKGKKYLIFGESGSGKSTLLKLILGLRQAELGQVLITGRRLETINLASYYRRLAYIEQSIYMITGSIRDNITLGANISEERLLQVINMVQLQGVIDKQPLGLDTPLQANAQGLSGGEKQRIALARAIIQDVDFIIIDESTSQLDDGNRELIEETILGFTGVGVIYVSHHTDSSILERFDQVLVSQSFRQTL